MYVSTKLRLLEHRQQRISEVRAKYQCLKKELEQTKQHLMLEPHTWTGECKWEWPESTCSSRTHQVLQHWATSVSCLAENLQPEHQQHCLHFFFFLIASLLFIQCPCKLFDILSVCLSVTLSRAAAGLRGGLPGVSGGSGDSDGQTGDESELLQSPPHDGHLLRRVLQASVDGQTQGRACGPSG